MYNNIVEPEKTGLRDILKNPYSLLTFQGGNRYLHKNKSRIAFFTLLTNRTLSRGNASWLCILFPAYMYHRLFEGNLSLSGNMLYIKKINASNILSLCYIIYPAWIFYVTFMGASWCCRFVARKHNHLPRSLSILLVLKFNWHHA